MILILNDVVLRPLEVRDALDIYRCVLNAVDEARANPGQPAPLPLRVIERRLDEGRSAVLVDDPNAIEWGISHRDDPIGRIFGVVGYYNPNEDHLSAEVGVSIGDPLARGRGYAGDAILLVADFAFTYANRRRVVGQVKSTNLPAQRLLSRLGLTEEAILEDARHEGGHWTAIHQFSVVKPNWDLQARESWRTQGIVSQRTTNEQRVA